MVNYWLIYIILILLLFFLFFSIFFKHRSNTRYYGGYHGSHPTINWLWDIVINDFTVAEKKQFLKVSSFYTLLEWWITKMKTIDKKVNISFVNFSWKFSRLPISFWRKTVKYNYWHLSKDNNNLKSIINWILMTSKNLDKRRSLNNYLFHLLN